MDKGHTLSFNLEHILEKPYGHQKVNLDGPHQLEMSKIPIFFSIKWQTKWMSANWIIDYAMLLAERIHPWCKMEVNQVSRLYIYTKMNFANAY